jgi:hypothetical protein
MRLIIALLILATVVACQVTTSQSMGGGVTIRNDIPIGEEQATDEQTTDDQDAEATEDRMPGLTIGGGFGAGVSH